MKAKDRSRKRPEKRAGEAEGDLFTGFPLSKAVAALKDLSDSGRLASRCLIAIIAFGCLIRLLHFWAISGTAFLKLPLGFDQSDMYAIRQWAQTIIAGDLLGRNTYHPYFEWMKVIAPLETWYRWWGGRAIFQQAPFYAYWVAGLLTLSNNSLGFVMFVQLLVGALHPLVIFWLARRLFDARVGLVAAALTAFYGPFIFHQGVLLRDWMPPLLEPLALLALLRARSSGRSLDWLLAGVALGLALVTKETILLFVPLALAWLVLEYRCAFRQAGAYAALVLLGLLLAFSPLVARNRIAGAPLFAISNRAAESFIQGNAADALPVGAYIPVTMREILARSDGRLPAVFRETLKTYEGDWSGFVGTQLFKLRGLVDPMEVPNNVSFSYGLEISPALWFGLRYGIIFPLGLAGLIVCLGMWRRHLLLLLYAVSAVAGVMATNILGRYRLVLVPILVLYGAAGLVWLFDAFQSGRTARTRLYLGLVVGLALVQHLLLPIRTLRDLPLWTIHPPEYFLSAQIYASEGRPDRAVAEMERLQGKAGQRPAFAEVIPQARLYEGNHRAAWAGQLIKEGKREEARRQVELAQAAYRGQRLTAPLATLGNLYLKLEEPEKAKRLFERFLELEPEGLTADAVRRILRRLEGSPS